MASSHFAPMWERTTMLKIIDNEHQSLCVTTGSRTASSNPTTILSTTAARLGTSSSTNHGASCPSDCANGPTGSDQWDLVLVQMIVQPNANRMELVIHCVRRVKNAAQIGGAGCDNGCRPQIGVKIFGLDRPIAQGHRTPLKASTDSPANLGLGCCSRRRDGCSLET